MIFISTNTGSDAKARQGGNSGRTSGYNFLRVGRDARMLRAGGIIEMREFQANSESSFTLLTRPAARRIHAWLMSSGNP